MTRFQVQPERPGAQLSQAEMLKAGEPYVEAEPTAEPLEQHDTEFKGKAKDRRQVERKLTVLKREKLTDFISRQASYVPEAMQNAKRFIKENVLDKAFPGMTEKLQRANEKFEDSVPVKFVEETGIGMRARLFMLRSGPSSALEPKIGKGQSEIEYLQQRQQQDAAEYNRVAKNFKGQDVGIDNAKKEKAAYWQDRIDRAKNQKEALEKQLKAKELEMEKLKDGLNNRIDNKIKKIEASANYPDNKERQRELAGIIKSVEGDLDKSKRIFKEFQDMQALLMNSEGGLLSSKYKSESAIFDEKNIEANEKDMSAGEKSAAGHARSVIKQYLEAGKISIKNISKDTSNKLKQFGKEIKILENNLAKLRKSKEKVDAVCVKTENRTAKWNLERKRLGIDADNKSIGKSEQVHDKISKEDAEALKPGIDAARKEFRDHANNPEHWFGKDAMDKVKLDGLNVGLDEVAVAKGLIHMKELAVKTVFDMDRIIPNLGVEQASTEDQKSLDAAQKQSRELGEKARKSNESADEKEEEAAALKRGRQNPSQEIRDRHDALVIEAAKIRDEAKAALKEQQDSDKNIRAIEKKISDDARLAATQQAQKDEWIQDQEFIQKEVIDKLTSKIPEDLGGKQRSWSEFKEVLFKVFPDLEQYEASFTNKDVRRDAPGMPEGETPDEVDKAAQRVLENIYGIDGFDGDPSKTYEKLLASFSDIESDNTIRATDKKDVMNVILSEAVNNIVTSGEQGPVAMERSILLMNVINARELSSESNKALADFIKEEFKHLDQDNAETFDSFGTFVEVLKDSVNIGTMEKSVADSVCIDIFDAYRSMIEKSSAGTITARAKDIADLALKMVTKLKGFIEDDAAADMFDKATKYLESMPHAIREDDGSVDLQDQDDIENVDIRQGEDALLGGNRWSGKLSENDLQSNAEFAGALSYIQRAFSKSGLANAQGFTFENLEQRANTLLIRAKASPDNVKNFNYLTAYARELAAYNNLDRVETLVGEMVKIAGNDPFKLMELGVALRDSNNPDVNSLSMDMYDKAFNMTDPSTKEGRDAQLKIIDCMLETSSMEGEHFDANLRNKFDAMYENSKNSAIDVWTMYVNVWNLSPKFKNEDLKQSIVEKLLLRSEALATVSGRGVYLDNLTMVAEQMRKQSMETDAKRVEIFVETEKLKVKNAEDAAEAAIAAQEAEEAARQAKEAETKQYESEISGTETENNFIKDFDAGDEVTTSNDYFPTGSSDTDSFGSFRGGLSPEAAGAAQPVEKPKKKGWFSSLLSGLFSLFGGGESNKE